MFVKNEEATYTLADNLSDGPSHSAAYRTLVFGIYTITVNGVESDPAYFTAVNGTPSAITGIRGSPTIGGVQFEWDRSPDQDHKGYKYKVKVGASGTWDTTWKNITDNKLAVVMTPGEISSFSSTATIVTHILDEDYYLQYSASVEASVKAGTISDNIFGIYITSSGGSGTLLDLIDGNRSTGGITF